MANATIVKVTQHDSVIAAELNHERVATPTQDILHHCFGEGIEMYLHVARCARVECVLIVKHFVRLRLLDQLEHAAFVTKRRRQLEKIFVGHLLGGEKAIRDRHSAERHEGLNGGVADAAASRQLVIHADGLLEVRYKQATQ